MPPRKTRPKPSRAHAEKPLPALQFSQPLPYGAVLHDKGVQFVVYSRSATGMRVLLYDKPGDAEPAEVIALDPNKDRWGDIWSIFVPGVGPGQLYHFQADGPFDPERGQRFDGRARLIDPYARALAGDFALGADGLLRPPKCVVVDDSFDWQGDRHLRRELADTVIYELHVRGFTASPTSGVAHPGTYRGVIETSRMMPVLIRSSRRDRGGRGRGGGCRGLRSRRRRRRSAWRGVPAGLRSRPCGA